MLQGSQVLAYIRQATDTARSPNPVMHGMDFLINLYSLYLSSSASLYLSLSQMYSMAREGSIHEELQEEEDKGFLISILATLCIIFVTFPFEYLIYVYMHAQSRCNRITLFPFVSLMHIKDGEYVLRVNWFPAS